MRNDDKSLKKISEKSFYSDFFLLNLNFQI